MNAQPAPTTHPLYHLLIIGCAAIVAILGCRDHPGSWNDASRLATVESLIDRHTFVIDDSIYTSGTLDKLRINGHFYSDKSPVPALLMAGPYWLWQQATGKSAADDSDAFCRLMTLTSSGLAYVVGVWCVFLVGGVVGLGLRARLILTASFGLCTVAPVYAQQVNNHILLLGVAGPLMLLLASSPSALRVFLVGLLGGLAYSIDLGVGPPLLCCLAGWVMWRYRTSWAVLLFGFGVLPFFVLHHVVNYQTGGTWKPANAVPEYLDYPGSPFTSANMTGSWQHPNPGKFLVYSLALLFGKKGFIGHNLPLFLCLPGAWWLIRRRIAEMPEVLFAVAWMGGTWLMYSAASNNSSGMCYGIRWFVPLLIPAYYLLALVLREWPEQINVLAILSAGGLLLSMWMMFNGPWTGKMLLPLWPTQVIVFGLWMWTTRQKSATPQAARHEPLAA